MTEKESAEDQLRKKIKKQHHRDECSTSICYCYDPDDGDAMCDCGRPAFACSCYDER